MISSADIEAYKPLTVNFARRELAARYKRSLLGWAWSIINPLAMVAIYTLVFGVVLRAPPPETANGRAEYFSLYLFNGLVVWGFFSGVLNGSMGWMGGVNEMRKKVYFPAETAIFGGAIAVGVQSALEMVVLFAIMAVLLNIGPTFLLFPFILLTAGLLGLGLGLVASILNTLYRDVSYLIGIVLQLGFFLVPIVYPPSLLPDSHWGLPIGTILGLHPMRPFIDAAHEVVYQQQLPTIGQVVAMLAWTSISLSVGLWYFRSRSMRISEEL